MQVSIIGWVADSAGALEGGTIEFAQAQRIDTGELLVTQSSATAQVVRGELRTLAGDPFSLPSNPEGTAVRVLERFGGRTFEWWTAVPEIASVEYRALPVVESSSVPQSVWGPPPWLAQVEAMRDETITAIQEGVAVADALGGLPGIQDKLAQADASATAAAGSAAAADTSAGAALAAETAARNAAGAAAVSSSNASGSATAAAGSATAAAGSASSATGAASDAAGSATTATNKASDAAASASAAAGSATAAAGSASAAAGSSTSADTAATTAGTEAARAKDEADRAQTVADSIDMGAINSRLDGMDTSITGKVDKTSEASKLYGTDAGGAQTLHPIASTVTGGAVAVRDGSGQLLVPTVPTAAQHAAAKSYVDQRVTLLREDFDLLASQTALIQDMMISTKIELSQTGTRTLTAAHEATLFVAPQAMYIRSVVFAFDNDVYITGAANTATFRILHRFNETPSSAIDVVRLATSAQQLNRRNDGNGDRRRQPWSMQNGVWGNDAARTVPEGNSLSWHFGAIVGTVSLALPAAITIGWSPVR